MPVLNIDVRTQKIVELLTALAKPPERFMPTWEYDKWIAGQEKVFLMLYRNHQDNPRVLDLLRVVDGNSRSDAWMEDAVRRACNLAPQYLQMVLDDIEERLRCPEMPKTGDPVFDSWADNRQVVHGSWGNDEKRKTVREQNRNMEYEVGSDGYVREKRK